LRTLRERDAREAENKFAELENLRTEVERLSGEVEVLRDVAEQGVRERRIVREENSRNESLISASQVGSDSEAEKSQDEDEDRDTIRVGGGRRPPSPRDDGSVVGRSSRSGSRSMSPRMLDRTMHTDRATIDTADSTSQVVAPELESLDDANLESLRSIRDVGAEKQTNGGNARALFSPARSSSPTPSFAASPSLASGASSLAPSPDNSIIQEARPFSRDALAREDARASSPRRRNKAGGVQRRVRVQDEVEDINANTEPHTPFPRIRGAQLERLFFAAPDVHDATTCRNCQRGAMPDAPGHGAGGPTPGWLRGAKVRDMAPVTNGGSLKGKTRFAVDEQETAAEDKMSPQVALVQVVRELEDDFTHYKRYVAFSYSQ
jgi:hypothetical protein